MLSTLLETALRSEHRIAVRGDHGVATYGDLLRSASFHAGRLLDHLDVPDLDGARIAILLEPGPSWVAALWSIWRAGGLAVPLALSHPEPELEHVLVDAAASAVVVERGLGGRVRPLARRLGLPVLTLHDDDPGSVVRPVPEPAAGEWADRFALLLYTSGTTGKPKGVPLRHRHLESQVRSLSEAWRWRPSDHVVGVLPLHHVHGIVNVLLSALWNGAECTLHRRFDAERVWRSFETDSPTLFMAVPTVYRRLIEEWQAKPGPQDHRSRSASSLRLMVSGSAALPGTTRERWQAITGHSLLERYGMTEIGMALSQPYDGARLPGTVGGALPGVEVRVEGDDLQVRSPGMFDGYWRRPDETAEVFTQDGFFRTGDVATSERGCYRLLGRRSVDILKSGGEKISALEIEAILRIHETVADAAVVGLDDPEWGQRVVAFVETHEGSAVEPDALRHFCRERLAAYKVPKEVEIVERLPRNALGKVVKGKLG
ncbi:MAG: acyl-CoA synthetase [Thermoanaerobaculia bacterium]|nr:acyl-CoA synthetase [Thermoanaerobaculia bacterium]